MVDDVMDVFDEEVLDDYFKLVGISDVDDMIDYNFLVVVKKRLFWFIILLFLGMMIVSLIGCFEDMLN